MRARCYSSKIFFRRTTNASFDIEIIEPIELKFFSLFFVDEFINKEGTNTYAVQIRASISTFTNTGIIETPFWRAKLLTYLRGNVIVVKFPFVEIETLAKNIRETKMLNIVQNYNTAVGMNKMNQDPSIYFIAIEREEKINLSSKRSANLKSFLLYIQIVKKTINEFYNRSRQMIWQTESVH